MLDADLAALYGVETKRLVEAVKRNRERFPDDFMFQLTGEVNAEVVANFDHLARLKVSPVSPGAVTVAESCWRVPARLSAPGTGNKLDERGPARVSCTRTTR